jgi:predicted porin
MQKKIIALAVAGLVSGAAFAQSNVTVYGIRKAKSTDGGQDGSRVGFKGTEDLGNGLSAFFQLGAAFPSGHRLQCLKAVTPTLV